MRQDEYDVRVTVDGRPIGSDTGTWDKFTGGEIDSEELTYKPGAMGPRISLGGSVNVGNVTVSVLYRTDVHNEVHWLASRVGKGEVVISKQPLDVNGVAWGKPITYHGKLKQINPPEHDSESNDAALLELEMTPAGSIV